MWCTSNPGRVTPELVVFLNTLLDRIAERPGFEDVSAVSVLPLGGSDSDTGIEIEGRPEPTGPGQAPTVWFRRVTPSYFRTMGVPVVRGREFAATDHVDSPRVVMINDVAGDRYWPGEDPLGKRLRFRSDRPWHTIVGIAKGVRHKGLAVAPTPELYFPFNQRPGRAMTLVVKSDLDDSTVAGLLRGDLGEIDPELPLAGVVSMAALMEFSVAQPRFFMSMTSAFGLLALALATVGIYGVLSYTVSRKSKEMGLRMALGANRTEVLSMVVEQGVRLTLVGIGAGLILSYVATRLMSDILFGIDPQDLIAFAGAPVVLTLPLWSRALSPPCGPRVSTRSRPCEWTEQSGGRATTAPCTNPSSIKPPLGIAPAPSLS
jgi:putative ABC transport system permease protein